MRTRRTPRRGTSLMEVLLSMAIFLMSLAAIGSLVDIGSDNAMDAAAQAAGTRLAQSKLAEVEAGAIPAAEGGSGTCDGEPEWNWTVTSQASDVTGVYVVTATVSRQFRSRTFEVSMTQMILDPQAMGGATEAQKPTDAATTGGTSTTGTGSP